jgi:hypothetical protein
VVEAAEAFPEMLANAVLRIGATLPVGQMAAAWRA